MKICDWYVGRARTEVLILTDERYKQFREAWINGEFQTYCIGCNGYNLNCEYNPHNKKNKLEKGLEEDHGA